MDLFYSDDQTESVFGFLIADIVSAILSILDADVASAILSCLQEVGGRTLLKWRPDDSSAIWALMVEGNRPITTDPLPQTHHSRLNTIYRPHQSRLQQSKHTQSVLLKRVSSGFCVRSMASRSAQPEQERKTVRKVGQSTEGTISG